MKPFDVSDDILIKHAREGDKNAFQQLVKRYEQQIAATVVGMLGPGPDAEEIGQDVFIRFYRSLQQFKGEASLGTYLTRIAINLSINCLKKRQRRQRLGLDRSGDFSEAMVSDREEQQVRRDADEIVQLALRRLKSDYRSVVVLRLIDGYSSQETADILRVPLGTVLSRLARGQKKMREIIEELRVEI